MIFCDRKDCVYNHASVCECCDDLWIGDKGCETYEAQKMPTWYEDEAERE